MNKQIPIYFDNVIIASPIEQVSESNPNLGRLQVGVFTKYGNRNGSYITDAVAEMLINSATRGDTPVIGFFDPESKTWAGHTGPTLANAYGYVENFDGWKPLTDTDGVTRDYAVFTVVIFTKYFEEAKLIIGQNQSMELDINSIDGDWADIEGVEYFVYTKAAIQGLCVIGSHEPCFSVSSFFEQKTNIYESQYEKFSSLLAEAKAQVEEATKNKEGGEQPMNELENQETVAVEETPVIEEFEVAAANTEEEAVKEEEVEVEVTEETAVEEEEKVEEVTEEETPVEEVVTEPTEYELLQNQYNELQSQYNDAIARVQELEASINDLTEQAETLKVTIQNFENAAREAEEDRKEKLIEKYEKILNDSEEIIMIKGKVKDYSYDELEGKLAIVFANKQFAGGEVDKVPLPEPQESQFALLMKKYRK